MPVSQIHKEAEKANISLYYLPLNSDLIPKKNEWMQFSGIENIIMIGYPKSISDKFNNMPIVRKGLTATYLKLQYQNRKEFLADIPVYPGSSGSPIFVYERGSFLDLNDEVAFGNKLYFVGINYAGIIYDEQGKVKTNPNLQKKDLDFINWLIENTYISTTIFSNLAVAIRADRLLEFESILRKKLK